MGFCCKGVSEIPSVLFHFLAVKQTKSLNVIVMCDPKIKVLCKITVKNCKVVIFFCFVCFLALIWTALYHLLRETIQTSNVWENFYDYMV